MAGSSQHTPNINLTTTTTTQEHKTLNNRGQHNTTGQWNRKELELSRADSVHILNWAIWGWRETEGGERGSTYNYQIVSKHFTLQLVRQAAAAGARRRRTRQGKARPFYTRRQSRCHLPLATCHVYPSPDCSLIFMLAFSFRCTATHLSVLFVCVAGTGAGRGVE